MIPESLLESPAGQSLPHAALKILSILVVGRTPQRNGTMCCSESYAAKFGIHAKATVLRSLNALRERCIIVVTRKVQKFRKHPTLYAVTWWPVAYRDGEPLARPEPATHAYLQWRPPTLAISVDELTQPAVISSHSPRDDLTLAVSVEKVNHHPHGDTKVPDHHPPGEGQSLYVGAGRASATRARGVKSRSDSGSKGTAAQNGKNGAGKRARRQPSAPRLNP